RGGALPRGARAASAAHRRRAAHTCDSGRPGHLAHGGRAARDDPRPVHGRVRSRRRLRRRRSRCPRRDRALRRADRRRRAVAGDGARRGRAGRAHAADRDRHRSGREPDARVGGGPPRPPAGLLAPPLPHPPPPRPALVPGLSPTGLELGPPASAAAAVPLATPPGGWRFAPAVFSLAAALSAAGWLALTDHEERPRVRVRPPAMPLRSPTAWTV